MKLRWVGLALGMAMACAGPSGSATVVIGDGFAEACSKAALGDRSDAQSIQQCDAALESEALDAHDRAGTLVNRGVMRLRREEFELARADFDAAIVLAPKAGEAYGNRGAVFVGEKRFQAGLDDINNALRLGVKEPEKAYFNRALAYEGLDDEKSAYLDFQQALTLKPGWELPEHELMRFVVSRRQSPG
jgi:tetratricopeptide (TPR) repeat protein